MHHLGKVLPVDGYRVQLITSLPTDYIQSLTHLYQPLLGIEAISLYQLLLHEIFIQSESQLQTHHTLMSYLNLPLDRIYEARLKLEGIGLLKTFKKETEETVVYTYAIQPPFSPSAFFQDMMLSELLYRHIGESKFVSLKNYYTDLNKQPVGDNITASFHEVFQTFKPSNHAIAVTPPQYKENSPKVPVQQMDFSLLQQSLKRKMIPVEKVLTETNRRIISQLAQLYSLESYEIEKSVEWALNEENRLDIEQFKAVCLDIFRTKHNISDVRLTVKQTSEQKLPQATNPLSKTEKLIERFESISPKELLEDLSSGNNASEQDVKFISDLMVSQGLPIPVMNVLIHYVMLRSDMKLPKGYMEKIASNWSRKKFTTAKEAVNFVQKQGEPKVTPRQNYQSRKQSNEIIPDWFKERKSQPETVPENVVLTKEQEREKEEMVSLLQKYASENN